MPELPEVEITVRGLREKVLGRTFLNVWADARKLVKKPSFEEFEKQIKGKKIKEIKRRGKYILFYLSGEKVMLAHQKMTGHFLYGEWKKGKKGWRAKDEAMKDEMNSHIHLLFKMDNGKMLAFSDIRKFGRLELWEKSEFEKKRPLSHLGPDITDKDLTFSDFKRRFKRRTARIKTLLMDQTFVAGIGNIYANEILWHAGASPFKRADELKEEEKRRIFEASKKVLKKALRFQGTSISDYRTAEGKEGRFEEFLRVYKREGEECPRCGKEVKRKKIGGRSAYWCPACQK